jgi:hypothetical protein
MLTEVTYFTTFYYLSIGKQNRNWGMKFYLIIQDETVIVQVRMGVDEDYHQTIHPGEEFNGIPYEQLRALAEQEEGLEIVYPSEGNVSH